MILTIHFLKKMLDENLRLNVFKGIVLSLKSNLPSTCKITWENTEFVLFTHI